jgi:hypothetical protein
MLDIETDWQGLLDLADRPNPWEPISSDSNRSSADFTGTPSYTAALDLARYGWPEGRERMAGVLSATAPALSRQYRTRLDVAGAYLVAALAAAGAPDCMVDRGEDFSPRPVVRLVVGVNFLSNVDKGRIINRGVAICRVIDALENSGTRVELIAGWHATASGDAPIGHQRFVAAVTVKDAEQPLDIDRIAFAFAHPSMNRRIGFRLREITKPAQGWRQGHGRTAPLLADDFPNAIIVQQIASSNEDQFATPALAFKTIARIMKGAGIEIDDPDAA